MDNFNVGDIVQHRLYPSDDLNPYYYVVKVEYRTYPVLYIKRLDETDPTIYCASLVNQELMMNRWIKVG